MMHDFEVSSQFQPINNTEPHLVQEIVSYFEVAEPIHWSFFTLVLISACSFIILSCFCCYLKCPNVMSKLFSCCCNSTCCLLKCFSKRVLERTLLRSRVDVGHNVPSESVQMLDINSMPPVSNQNGIEAVSLNSSRQNVIPSAPNMSLDSNISARGVISNTIRPASVQSLAASPSVQMPGYLSDCRSGFPSCFCKKGTQPCQGPMQRPPF